MSSNHVFKNWIELIDQIRLIIKWIASLVFKI